MGSLGSCVNVLSFDIKIFLSQLFAFPFPSFLFCSDPSFFVPDVLVLDLFLFFCALEVYPISQTPVFFNVRVLAIHAPRGYSTFFSLLSFFAVATYLFSQREVKCEKDKGAPGCSSLKKVRAGTQQGETLSQALEGGCVLTCSLWIAQPTLL